MLTFVILLVLLSLALAQIDTNSDDRILVTIFAITNNKSSLGNNGVQNTGGHWLAIQEINNNTDFLPQYIFELIVLDAQKDPQESLKRALQVTKYQSNATHIYFPLIIGAPWSTLCTSISPFLGIKYMGSISCGATSVVLSNTNKYPYFYRTIPTDALQVNGTIELCYQFGWKKIVVVYVNDVYGSYFSLGIQELSKKNKSHLIDVTSIAISNDEPQTYKHAATQIKESNIYVIVIVSHSNTKLIDTFKTEGILTYPYYIIGTDGWFNSATIHKWANNFSVATVKDLQGFIGPVPWRPDMSSLTDVDEYPQDIKSTVEKSLNKLNEILKLWKIEEENGNYNNLHTNSSNVLSTMIYAYDAMYVIGKVIEEMENNTNLSLMDLVLQDDDELITMINNIIEKVDFIGASGRVAFDTHGDRKNALYSLGNTLANGDVSFFGFFYQDIFNNGKIKLVMDPDKIEWPIDWGNKVPRLDIVLHDQIITIDTSVSNSIFACLCISLLIAFVCMLLVCCYRKNMIIKHASWKLNVSVSIGTILLYGGAILYGIDESYIFDEGNIEKSNELTIFCNLRLWMCTISCTLLFMPIFLKTYRLSHIFKNVLVKTVFSDEKLFVYTGICIVIDIILLILFTFLAGLTRDYHISDKWMWAGSCAFGNDSFADDNSLNWLFYGSVVFWKLCELIFGIYCGLIVSRIQDGTNILRRYDETGMQLLSILITCFVISIASLIFVFGANDIEANQKANFDYYVISISILLIGNIVLFFNLFPRIFAVITGNDKKFIISPEKRMEDKIRKQLKRYRDALSPKDSRNIPDTPCTDEKDALRKRMQRGGTDDSVKLEETAMEINPDISTAL